MKNSIKRDKVLIIGAKGMLGQDLKKVFRRSVCWDFEDFDIAQKAEVFKKIGRLRPSIIINAAAYNNVDACEKKEGWAIAKKVNILGPQYLAEIAKRIGAIFVQYSTDYVFPGTKKLGYKESDAPRPISAYAKSKFLGEEVALKYNSQTYVIRTCRLFGLAGGGKKSFVDVMLELARRQSEIKVVDAEFSSPTYTKDLAERTRYILQKKFPFGVYHVTNRGACTWYDFAKEIFRIKKKKIKLIRVTSKAFPRPAKRPAYSPLLNTKLPAMRSWQSALKEFLESKKSRPM